MRRVFSAAVASLLVLGAADAQARRHRRVPPLTKDGLPNVQAKASIVMDVNSGEVLYAKKPDKVRYIASTGKIFVAMVVRAHNLDLQALTKITKTDLHYARGGSRSRLRLGHRFHNLDLLRAMLMASDNRACTALARAVHLSPHQLVSEMNQLAHKLGLTHTTFTDPSGLNGNTSTAREMAKALHTAMLDPLLAKIMGTKTITVRSVARRPRSIKYFNTNVSLRLSKHRVTGGKTGYTKKAGHCLLIAAELKGRELAMVFLGTHGTMTRFADFKRVAGWILRRRRAKSPKM